MILYIRGDHAVGNSNFKTQKRYRTSRVCPIDSAYDAQETQ